MMNKLKAITVVFLLAAVAFAQRQRRDPLTAPEVDKLRDSAQEPVERLKLYVEFARARLDKLEQVHADKTAKDREQQTRDALQDFAEVYDELGDNVDTFADRGDDLRKALKPVIEADTEFGAKLRAFQGSLNATGREARDDEFLLSSALEAVDEGAKDHRALLAEQEEAFKHKKKQQNANNSRPPE